MARNGERRIQPHMIPWGGGSDGGRWCWVVVVGNGGGRWWWWAVVVVTNEDTLKASGATFPSPYHGLVHIR